MAEPIVLEIREYLRVNDPKKLLAYARKHAESWGMDPTDFEADDMTTLTLAARETLIRNVVTGSGWMTWTARLSNPVNTDNGDAVAGLPDTYQPDRLARTPVPTGKRRARFRVELVLDVDESLLAQTDVLSQLATTIEAMLRCTEWPDDDWLTREVAVYHAEDTRDG